MCITICGIHMFHQISMFMSNIYLSMVVEVLFCTLHMSSRISKKYMEHHTRPKLLTRLLKIQAGVRDHILKDDTFSSRLGTFFGTVWGLFMYMLGCSYVSAAGAILLLTIAIVFVPSKVSWKKRLLIEILHVSAHLAAALILMLLMELGIEICIRLKLLANSGKELIFW
ncbi:hypothetical protein RDI58_017550 [Solanum bulbocastanum]|uniref:Uncharacterized protein n=1 Tax=Solanum bulbocastanum TaxID=147425 RepID=A0AAN8TEV4_SOLBU